MTPLHLSKTAGRYLMRPKGPIITDLLNLVRSEPQQRLFAIKMQTPSLSRDSMQSLDYQLEKRAWPVEHPPAP